MSEIRKSMTHQWMIHDRFVIEEDRDYWKIAAEEHPLRAMESSRRALHASRNPRPRESELECSRLEWEEKRDAMIASGKGLS